MTPRELLTATFDALAFSAHKHRSQRRKDAEASPYINHPIAVARTLVDVGGVTDVEVVQAAILHDTLEDTDTTEEELRERFGDRVTELVLHVTDDKSLPKDERKRLQIEHAAAIPAEARLVKLADKISNVRDILENPPRDWSEERRREYLRWATEVVDRMRGTHAALEAEFDGLVGRG